MKKQTNKKKNIYILHIKNNTRHSFALYLKAARCLPFFRSVPFLSGRQRNILIGSWKEQEVHVLNPGPSVHRLEGNPQVCQLSRYARTSWRCVKKLRVCPLSQSETNVTEGAPYRSSPSAELKLLLRLLSLEAAPGEPAERSGSAPNGESGSSIRISSSRRSSLGVKKSVK